MHKKKLSSTCCILTHASATLILKVPHARPRVDSAVYGLLCCVVSCCVADTDKLFPVIGFGGKLGPEQPANHAFAVNFQEDRPEVEGMAGVLQVGVVLGHAIKIILKHGGTCAIWLP